MFFRFRSPSRSFAFRALALLACFGAASPALAREKTEADESLPLISETRVIAPKRVGEFDFVASHYDEKYKLSGAQIRYAHPRYPALRFDVFVYPIGKMPQDEAIKRGMRDFRANLDAVVKTGFFRDFKIVATDPFEIRPTPPPQPKSEASKIEASAAAETPATSVEAVKTAETAETAEPMQEKKKSLSDDQIKTLIGLAPIKGERMTLSYRTEDKDAGGEVAMRSRGYLFYKQLYFFKGRISATESEIDEAAFSEIADRAMRELIPAIKAHNIGACGQTTIAINPDAPKERMMEEMTKAMTDAMTRTAEDNCDTSFDAHEYAQLRETAEIVGIEYTPQDWGGQ